MVTCSKYNNTMKQTRICLALVLGIFGISEKLQNWLFYDQMVKC